MKAAGLQARAWRRNRNRAAVKRFFGELPNRQLNITTSHPDQVWVGDVTYLKVAGRWHYLSIVLDKHTRRLLGWRLGRQRDIALTMAALNQAVVRRRSEEHTSELQSLMRISYAVFCLKKKKKTNAEER